jgi:hypothetical protein
MSNSIGIICLTVIKWSVGRLGKKWEGNIKMNLKGIVCDVRRLSKLPWSSPVVALVLAVVLSFWFLLRDSLIGAE